MNIDSIYEKYFTFVYKYILSLCQNVTIAEDITQETFYKALKNLDTFEGKSKIETWLCQIAKNLYFNQYIKDNRNLKFGDTNVPGKSAEKNLILNESSFEIHKILFKLPEPYKEVFSLRTFGELSFSQIGELFEKSESWARVTHHRAKLKIKEELE